jgi:hypothetical protein
MDQRKFIKTTGTLLASTALAGADAVAKPEATTGRSILPINRNWRYHTGVVEDAARRRRRSQGNGSASARHFALKRNYDGREGIKMSAFQLKLLSHQGRILLFLANLAFMAVPAFAINCAHLASLKIDHVTITKAEVVDHGIFKPAGGEPITGLPVFCRVAATLKPSQGSDIRIEVRMPEDSWNGRIEGTGNGGFAGNNL